MSEIGLSYDTNTIPSSIGVVFGLSFSSTTLKATVNSIDNFIITLAPSGNISEQILSGVAWPLAQTLGAILPPMAKNLIYGYSFDVVTVSSSSYSVEGEPLTVNPSNLNLSSHNGMLLLQGDLNIT